MLGEPSSYTLIFWIIAIGLLLLAYQAVTSLYIRNSSTWSVARPLAKASMFGSCRYVQTKQMYGNKQDTIVIAHSHSYLALYLYICT